MGHSWSVHQDFYGQYDTVGERLDVAKLLLLQDQNKLNDYRDKNLGEIDVEQLARAQFKESSSDNNQLLTNIQFMNGFSRNRFSPLMARLFMHGRPI